MDISDFSREIFLDRYALRDAKGRLLEQEPSQMWGRVASFVANAEQDVEKWCNEFYSILEDFKFVPAGRVLSAAGQDLFLTSNNCFCIPSPEDSRGGIMKSLTEWVEIQSRGGGVGINMSSLRPKDAYVAGVNGTSSGPVTWMELFSQTASVIIQGGSRRGAGMIMLNIDHPDIEEFIEAKQKPGVLAGANLSVCITDAFMEHLLQGASVLWPLYWKGRIVKSVDPLELWNKICEFAWACGEPGLFFIDTANKFNNIYYAEDGIIQASNPCGEQPLSPYGACNLGSINLLKFYDPRINDINYPELISTIHTAIRFMDDVIDLSFYPLPQIKEKQLRFRRVGLGVMGLADLLLKMRIRYGSNVSLEKIEEIFVQIRNAAYMASVELAEEKGHFPGFDAGKFLDGEFIKTLPECVRAAIAESGTRNSTLLSIAPTGTIAILADVSAGIEPNFAWQYERKDRTGLHEVIHHDRAEWKMLHPEQRPPDYFVTAADVLPAEHIAVQALIQKYVDAAVSKTINLPNSATVENVKQAYEEAYKHGIKGLTVYRDGSRLEQVLNPISQVQDPLRAESEGANEVGSAIVPPTTIKPADSHCSDPDAASVTHIRRKLPSERNSITHKFSIGENEGYLTVGLFDDNTPGEIFVHFSKEGSTVSGLTDSLAVMVSLALQHGVPLALIVEKMAYRKFDPSGLTSNKHLPFATSPVDYIFRWMEDWFLEEKVTHNNLGEICPACGAILIMEESCLNCHSCGYSKC